MTERERLIHLLCNVDCNGADRREGGCSFRQDSRCNVIQKLDMCMVETIVDHLLANGVIVPPCKAGDTVYYVIDRGNSVQSRVSEIKIHCIEITDEMIIYANTSTHHRYNYVRFGREDIGKTVFLAREEAEKALAERSKT